MPKIITIHQPHYLPYPGFFNKILQSDIFIILDNVQFVKNEWINRNIIKGPNGKVYMSIPVNYRYPQKINEVQISENFNWKKKHTKSIKSCYGKSEYFNKYYNIICDAINIDEKNLSKYLIKHIKKLLEVLKIDIPVYIASELNIKETDPTLRIIKLCKFFGGASYLSGPGGRNYLDENLFKQHNLELKYQDYKPAEYKQLFTVKGFISNISIIDMLFNEGIEIIERLKD